MISLIDVQDLETIYKLGSELHSNFSNIYNYSSLNEDVNKTYKLVESNEIMGFIHIQDLVDEIDVIDIIVKKENRSMGYGSKLLEFVLKEFSNKKFILEVSNINEKAINLYKKYGFEVINIRKGYMHGEDALVMEKK